jgi:hypothetical protein
MNISRQFFCTSSDRKLEGGYRNYGSLSTHTASFKFLITCLVFSFACITLNAQSEPDLKKTYHDRSVKIINTLELTDSGKYKTVVELLAAQYFQLNQVHDKTKISVAAIRSLQLSDEEKNNKIYKEEGCKKEQLIKLHEKFISTLQKNLTASQVEKIKDGMTYRVMPLTYAAYLEMILTLTPEQKEKIYNWLKEARELAMDEGSSDDKHKVFGKFKGRINNYLSAQGYDMKKEEKAWQQRLKEKRQKDAAQ